MRIVDASCCVVFGLVAIGSLIWFSCFDVLVGVVLWWVGFVFPVWFSVVVGLGLGGLLVIWFT